MIDTAKMLPESRDFTASGQSGEKTCESPKAAFVRQASHDIQGTFFGVSSLCAMIKNSKESPENIDELVEHLMEACHSYKQKLSNFLEYTRLQAGLHDTILERVNIRLLLNTIITENHAIASEKKVNLALFVSDGTPEEIISDEFRIAQICNNLVSNAINFSPAGSSVFVQVEFLEQTRLTIAVKDNGEGMTLEQMNSVFTLSGMERKCLKNPGGLGLLVTKYLVEDLLKGKIALSSQPGIGSCCTVILPLEGKILRKGHVLTDQVRREVT